MLPPDLVGSWESNDLRYEDRSLLVTSGQLLYKQGRETVHSGVIDEIVLIPMDLGREGVQVKYSDKEGVEFDTLIIIAADRESLVFDNNPGVRWRRAGEAQ